jgi:hypothetical protein
VQQETELQTYNRYSYGFNNPLAGTDPTGYLFGIGKAVKSFFGGVSDFVENLFHDPIGTVVGTAENIVKQALDNPVKTFATIAVAYYTGIGVESLIGPGIIASAAGGFAGGLVSSGGDFRAGLQGAITAGAFNWAGGISDPTTRLAAHAAIGCGSAVASGGNCFAGAVSAGVAHVATAKLNNYEGLNAVGRGIAVTVIGGTASVLGGGDFANGAVTAAYGYLFNHCSHGGCTTKLEQALYDWWPGYKAGTLLYNQTLGDGSWTGWEMLDAASVGTLGAGRALQGLQAFRAGSGASIEFGGNANQASHTFRHIDAIGVPRDAVTAAIRADVPALQVGQGVTRTVTVNGTELTYRAHRVNETSINIGRITPP